MIGGSIVGAVIYALMTTAIGFSYGTFL